MTYKKKYHTPEGLKHIWAKHKKALGELEAEDTMPDNKPAPQFGELWRVEKSIYGSTSIYCRNEMLAFHDVGPSPENWISESVDLQRLCDDHNAMANIPDPQGFVREVRELLERCAVFLSATEFSAESSYSTGTPYSYCGECGEAVFHKSTCERGRLKSDLSALLARLDAGRGTE